MKKIFFLLILFTYIYSVPKINPVSPYINRGVSLHFQASYNPLTIKYNYKKEAFGNQYAAYAYDIYLTQAWVRDDGYISIGSKNEKHEFLVSAIPSFPPPARIYFRYNNKILDSG